jgi:hydrogenase nickel incorporation protein HypA/HybF
MALKQPTEDLEMHELAVCQALLSEVTEVAVANGASRVTGVKVLVGPLSGVESPLLERAFEFARLGTLAATAKLTIETDPIRILCRRCGVTRETDPSYLRCPDCGERFPHLVSGDAMTLASVAIEREVGQTNETEGTRYV